MENFSVLIRFELSEKRNTINKKGQLFRDCGMAGEKGHYLLTNRFIADSAILSLWNSSMGFYTSTRYFSGQTACLLFIDLTKILPFDSSPTWRTI